MAVDGRRSGDDLACSTRLSSGRHRLANAAENLASDGGRLTIFAYKFTRLWFPSDVTNTVDSLPSDLIAAHALILAERAARLSSEARAAQVETDLAHAQATASSADALIARLRLEIEKLRRTLYGVRSERKERLIDQLEMQLEDAEADATEDELAAERAAPSCSAARF